MNGDFGMLLCLALGLLVGWAAEHALIRWRRRQYRKWITQRVRGIFR